MSYDADAYFQDSVAREIIERSPAIAIRVTGETGKWNTEFITKNINQYGYDQRDFHSGKIKWRDVVHPDDLQALCESIDDNARRGIDRYDSVYRVVTARGESVWVSDAATVVRDERGEVRHSDRVISDYTKAMESRARIEDNARQLDVLNDILVSLHGADIDQAFHIILDRTGKYLNISRVLLFEDTPDHTGCAAVYEWRNEGISSIMAEGEGYALNYERDIPEIGVDLAMKGEKAIDYGQVPINSADEFEKEGVIATCIFAVYLNEERYGFICFDECVMPRRWDQNTLHFLRTASKLVSTAVMRKQTADAARTSQVTMETVLDNIPTYIFVVDPVTRDVVFANKAYRRNFPGEAGEFQEDSLRGGIERNCAACPQYLAKKAHHVSRYFEVELKPQKKWIGVQCSGIPWIDGRPIRLFSGQDITEKKETEEYIRHIAFMDHLTGLPNRYRCDVDLNNALKDAKETGRKGYVLFLDMDDFKIVNDGYGHDYGDALLIEFAAYLRSTGMPGNRVFRFGGDEFVLLIDPDNADYIHDIIKGMVDRARKPWAVIDKSFYCTISIGVVAFPDGDMGIKEILKNADIAMYEAKKLGKNSFTFYSDNMRNDSIERAEMESMLRECIAGGFHGFEPYYQPYVEVRSGRIIGAETLIRWFRPDGQLVMPVSFIGLSEYLGLIVPIGGFILREAAKQLKKINDSGFPDFCMSVNVSIRQLQQQDIVRQVEDVLNETGANPKNLILEITEGLEITGLQRIQIILGELSGKGIQIAMDDFGTGYSSLSNMRDMPIDIIKIDRSFIQNIARDAYSGSFIKLIADFSHVVRKTICIEGVETEEQLRYCQRANVDYIQGFYFYRPMPGKALEETVFGKTE